MAGAAFGKLPVPFFLAGAAFAEPLFPFSWQAQQHLGKLLVPFFEAGTTSVSIFRGRRSVC